MVCLGERHSAVFWNEFPFCVLDMWESGESWGFEYVYGELSELMCIELMCHRCMSEHESGRSDTTASDMECVKSSGLRAL